MIAPTTPDGKPSPGTPCGKCGGPTQILFAGPGGWSDICNDPACGDTKSVWLTDTMTREEVEALYGRRSE